MSEIQISKSEYEGLVTKASSYESLKSQYDELKVEAENKTKGIQERNEKLETYKKQLEETTSSFEAYKGETAEKLKAFDGFDDFKVKAESWDKYQAEQTEAMNNEITSLKETLGEEFLTAKADFLDGLDEKKTLAYLKDAHSQIAQSKDNVPTGGKPAGMDNTTGTQQVSKMDIAREQGDWRAMLGLVGEPRK